jgi:ribosomal protein L21E
MVQRIGGNRRKSRHKMSKNIRERGKFSLRRFLQKFIEGDKVYLVADSAYQKASFPSRFQGKNGTIKKKIGRCYEVQIKDINKVKTILTHPIHLKKA